MSSHSPSVAPSLCDMNEGSINPLRLPACHSQPQRQKFFFTTTLFRLGGLNQPRRRSRRPARSPALILLRLSLRPAAHFAMFKFDNQEPRVRLKSMVLESSTFKHLHPHHIHLQIHTKPYLKGIAGKGKRLFDGQSSSQIHRLLRHSERRIKFKKAHLWGIREKRGRRDWGSRGTRGGYYST